MMTEYANIEVRNGEPYIEGTQTKVRMLVRHHRGYGWDGEELQRNFPHLSRSQVYSALAYYYDHKEEMDRLLEEEQRFADALEVEWRQSPARARLLAKIEAYRGSDKNID